MNGGEAWIPAHRRLWLYGAAVLALAFLFLPTLIVVPMSFSDARYLEFPPRSWSFRWYANYAASPEWRSATEVSLTVALLTTLVATPLGTAAAYALHTVRGRATRAAWAVLTLPMTVPVILIAIGAFYLYARLGLNNTIAGLTLAHSVLALPLVMIAVGAGLRQFDMNQQRVAMSLGATPWKAFLTITLPQIRVSVITGALFAFITSLDEVVLALFISSGDAATIQKRMFDALRDEIDPTVAVISTCLVVLSIAIVLAAQVLSRGPRRRREDADAIGS